MSDLSSIRKFLSPRHIEDHGIMFTLRYPSRKQIEQIRNDAGDGDTPHYTDRLLVGCVHECVVFPEGDDPWSKDDVFHVIAKFGGLKSPLVRACLDNCGLKGIVDAFDEGEKQAEEMTELLKQRTLAKIMGDTIDGSGQEPEVNGALIKPNLPDPHSPFA